MCLIIIKADYEKEIISLQGQIKYTETALSSELENWERKEYEAVKSSAENRIIEIENLLNNESIWKI